MGSNESGADPFTRVTASGVVVVDQGALLAQLEQLERDLERIQASAADREVDEYAHLFPPTTHQQAQRRIDEDNAVRASIGEDAYRQLFGED